MARWLGGLAVAAGLAACAPQRRPAGESTPPQSKNAVSNGDFEEAFEVRGGTVELSVVGSSPGVSPAALRAWVESAAQAVAAYYGHFPVKRVTVVVRAGGWGGLGGGVAYQGRRIMMNVGRRAVEADLLDDWQMTHEMFHLGFPDLDSSYSYMHEGMATYLEPIARVRVGDLSAEHVWRDLVEGLPQGLPRAGDRGLDRTHTWGRTYWGGALFWLLADVEIRERTSNAKSLDHAMRAILDAGGDGAAMWTLEKVLETGDAATGTTVLRDLHARMGESPGTTDLDALWKRLGVVHADGMTRFDADAPMAPIRAAITVESAP